MSTEELKKKPLWQMTGEEFLELQKFENGEAPEIGNNEAIREKYVYGLAGIAKIFGCSIPTANRIKKGGKIDKAITQIGRKIIVDVEMALELAGKPNGGRR
ncbi:DUF3853 family protein [Sunxiuqinia elliptica]